MLEYIRNFYYGYTFLCVIKSLFPHSLFKAALACLHVPATSLPAERIFSLAGYVVRDRRTKLLPDNVNKLIFLHQNIHVLPEVPAPVIQRHYLKTMFTILMNVLMREISDRLIHMRRHTGKKSYQWRLRSSF